MTKRRTILICVAGALAAIFVVQIFLGMRSPQKSFKIKEKADFISIENSGETIILEKKGDEWFCAAEKADANKVEYLVEKFCEVQTLGIVARSADDATLARYGLDSPIIVRGKAGEKDLRAIFIGKESASASQAYVQIEGKKEIFLAQGNLRHDFTFSANDIALKLRSTENFEGEDSTENFATEIVE